MNSRIHLALLMVAIVTLSGCQSTNTSLVRPNDEALTQAEMAEQAGDYLTAAQQYLALAEKTKGPNKSMYYFRAAQAYYQLQQYAQTIAMLNQVNYADLSSTVQFEMTLMQAKIAMAEQQPEQALLYLNNLDPFTLSSDQLQDVLLIKVDAYRQTENWLELANSYIKLSSLVYDSQARAYQADLWYALMQMTPQALDVFNPGMPPAIDSGWFALAYAVQSYQMLPETLTVALEDWQRLYPNHPADPSLYQDFIKQGVGLPEDVAQIAVLLPNSGPFASAAKAIKRGIVAAHLSAQSSAQLRFYSVTTDSKTGTTDVLQQYNTAVSNKASVVIGPLSKQAVNLLAAQETLAVPVIALNRAETVFSQPNLFQFGLAPEDDAYAAAEYAINNGLQRALVLAPKGKWGDRIASAFIDAWLANGGTLINQGRYDAKKSDFSYIIKPLLALNSSKDRKKALQSTLNQTIEYEPRRRQDIDFLFLAAKPLKARQLMPQLKFHRYGNLPVIATSHAYNGKPNPQQDIDLNGMILSQIPWAFAETRSSDPVYNALTNNDAKSLGSLNRLYALGVDAYHLIAELNTMTRSQSVVFAGATGELSIDSNGNIKRKTRFASFKNGKIKLLPEIIVTTP
jgi:hypothetical protein